MEEHLAIKENDPKSKPWSDFSVICHGIELLIDRLSTDWKNQRETYFVGRRSGCRFQRSQWNIVIIKVFVLLLHWVDLLYSVLTFSFDNAEKQNGRYILVYAWILQRWGLFRSVRRPFFLDSVPCHRIYSWYLVNRDNESTLSLDSSFIDHPLGNALAYHPYQYGSKLLLEWMTTQKRRSTLLTWNTYLGKEYNWSDDEVRMWLDVIPWYNISYSNAGRAWTIRINAHSLHDCLRRTPAPSSYWLESAASIRYRLWHWDMVHWDGRLIPERWGYRSWPQPVPAGPSSSQCVISARWCWGRMDLDPPFWLYPCALYG